MSGAEVLAQGVRYIVATDAVSAMASVNVQWLGAIIQRTPEEREKYKEFADRDDTWVHETPEAAWAAIDRVTAQEMKTYGNTRGWDPSVFRVEIGIEKLTRP